MKRAGRSGQGPRRSLGSPRQCRAATEDRGGQNQASRKENSKPRLLLHLSGNYKEKNVFIRAEEQSLRQSARLSVLRSVFTIALPLWRLLWLPGGEAARTPSTSAREEERVPRGLQGQEQNGTLSDSERHTGPRS